ncbi:hypothetical protein O6072_18270 [Mycolicibacterium neoaurum]|uniref:hypothetical protein n=1 Tax=Mycolicibacterium neoaurum TaxID=1795 RepID=UPI00248B4CAC|nr:hypothetical protein [Mycolicibacterium neoaurum]WBP93233.1 hypothetical protein O7W24_18975 [Mycolicibacterium neoaurum]WBS06800.1 hypothetical protein O6072_18270 [Mycolicibacterium neoaurum]
MGEDRLVQAPTRFVAGGFIELARVFEQAEADIHELLGSGQLVHDSVELLGEFRSLPFDVT